MLSWILTEKEKIIAKQDDALTIEEQLIIKSMALMVRQEDSILETFKKIELPNSLVFYKPLNNKSNYILFIRTGESVDIEKINKVFEAVTNSLSMYSNPNSLTEEDLQKFEDDINTAIREIRKSKMVILGYAAVGKTTIKSMLKDDVYPLRHNPTIGTEIDQLTGELVVWDTAGQAGYLQLLPLYIQGANLVVVVSDSSLENALKTKRLVMPLRKDSKAKFVLIANMQDLPTSLTPDRVAQIVGIESHLGLTALDHNQRQKLITFLLESLERV